MIISAKIIEHPRKQRTCEHDWKPIVGPQVRLYGAAERGDPPYVIYTCREHCGTVAEERLQQSERARKEGER